MYKKEGIKEHKKENSDNHPDFVKWFSELNKDSGLIAGGKGAIKQKRPSGDKL